MEGGNAAPLRRCFRIAGVIVIVSLVGAALRVDEGGADQAKGS